MMKREQKKLKEVATLYGSHMAMRLATERAILGQGGRLAGESSHHALKMHMGLYDEFTPQDFMNDPYKTPDMPVADPRVRMEAKYGLI